MSFFHQAHILYILKKKHQYCCERPRFLEGCSQKEIWVLRAPPFWVIVWSCHLFFIQKKKKKENIITCAKYLKFINWLYNYILVEWLYKALVLIQSTKTKDKTLVYYTKKNLSLGARLRNRKVLGTHSA